MLRALISKFRKQHANLFLMWIGQTPFIVCPLNRKLYEQIVHEAEDEDDRNERVCLASVLHPKIDVSRCPGGWISTLAPEIIRLSGFSDPQGPIQIFEGARQANKAFEMQAENLIKFAFPEIRFDEMKSWNIYELMDHLARAEWLMKNAYDIDPGLDLHPPEQPGEEETVENIRKQGMDPMRVLPPPQKKPYMDTPLITQGKWNKERVVNAIRQRSIEGRNGLLE